jgi:Asp-tRNA(Asn)/Glu-tRNA(Gln) amidotransferase A subunit family amidase
MAKLVSQDDLNILNKPVSEIVKEVQANQLAPADVLSTYMRKAIRAQVETNCLTEILVDAAKTYVEACNKEGPLAGMPVSLKDVSML